MIRSGRDPTSTSNNSIALRLPNTTNARAWLSQFDAGDQETAVRLISALTLVSHSAFERALLDLIMRTAEGIIGPVALYATRETNTAENYFELMGDPLSLLAPLSAVGPGADLGSEARCAALIRNLCRTDKDKYLNHPSLETLRKSRARAIFVVDDIVGSGRRTTDFISAMWHSPSIMSWHSRHQIHFHALAYTATTSGRMRVEAHRSRPKLAIVRDCPVLTELPWRDDIEQKIVDLVSSYGAKTSRPKMQFGFDKTMAALVFEHGCPNNVPSILWAPHSKKIEWRPLFPDRSVLPEEASAFPPDILKRDPIAILTDLSDEDEEMPAAVLSDPPLGIGATTVLALVAQGVRSRTTLSYALSLSARECTDLLDRCVARGYLTMTLRLTAAGRSELNFDGRSQDRVERVPPIGSNDYHPHQLRGPPGG